SAHAAGIEKRLREWGVGNREWGVGKRRHSPLPTPHSPLPTPYSLQMPYELFIALRYLRARRRQAAVSVITAIAGAGITLGVAALVIAQALITGFRADVQDKVLQGTAHINLLRVDNGGIENYRELVERVRAAPGVSAASATIYAQALLSAHG